jgi:ligand-binding SRPBCC domain-containing protein
LSFIFLETLINAPLQRVFDLGRSIEMHEASTKLTSERAIDGKIKGLINKGETITWQAVHLFKTRKLKVRITKMDLYIFFQDEMLQGDFKSMKHEHYFTEINGGTLMTDKFYFESPFGIVGKLFNYLFLKNYMKRFLIKRNEAIKEYSESEQWKTVLS